MAVETTSKLSWVLPVPGTEKGTWGPYVYNLFLEQERLLYQALKTPLQFPITASGNLLGHTTEVGSALAVPTTLEAGTGRVAITINAGSDLVGTLSVLGDVYDPYNDTVTATQTEALSINGAGTYTTQAIFIGGIEIAYSNLTLTDYDVASYLPYENRLNNFTVESLEVSGLNLDAGATCVITLTTFTRSSNTLVTAALTSLSLAGTSSASRAWCRSKTILSSAINTQYSGVVLGASLSDSAHWDRLLCRMTIRTC